VPSSDTGLKMSFRQVPKTPALKKRSKNKSKLKALALGNTNSREITKLSKSKQPTITLNVNNVNVDGVVTTQSKIEGKPQPFRQKKSTNSLTGKTGQPRGNRVGGKLTMPRKNNQQLPLTNVISTLNTNSQASTSTGIVATPPTTDSADLDKLFSSSRGSITSPVVLPKRSTIPLVIHDEQNVPVPHVRHAPAVIEPLPAPTNKAYSIINHRRRYVAKYGVEEVVYKVKFTDEWEGRTLHELQGYIYMMFEDLLNQVKKMYDDNVRCRLYLRHADLAEDRPLFIALRPINTMSADTIMHALVKLLNSHQSLKIDKSLIIHIGIMDLPRGGGYKKLTRRNAADVFNEKFDKKSILIIKRDKKHPTCAARAIVVATARLRQDPYYNNIRNPKRNDQYDIAFELLRAVNLPTHKEIEIKRFSPF
jgi:hypothetical protein